MPTTDKKPTASVNFIPDGFHSVTPHLVCAGAANAVEFYKTALGATELLRVPGPGGKLMHACLQIGDSKIMLVDEFPDYGSVGPNARKGTSVTLHLYVPSVDRSIERAVAAGAVIQQPATDMFWGDRYGMVKDPFGHQWGFATHLRDMTAEEIKNAADCM